MRRCKARIFGYGTSANWKRARATLSTSTRRIVALDKTSFTRYAKDDFGAEEQEALRDLCRALHERGVKFLLSNSDSSSNLYNDCIFQAEIVKAPRMVNSKADGRSAVDELLVRNY